MTAARTRGCVHEHVVTKYDIDGLPDPLELSWRECLDCGTWLPMGPSNDSPEAVAIEIRAAELADKWSEYEYLPGTDRFDWCPTAGSDGLCGSCESLYLAHAIAHHDSLRTSPNPETRGEG